MLDRRAPWWTPPQPYRRCPAVGYRPPGPTESAPRRRRASGARGRSQLRRRLLLRTGPMRYTTDCAQWPPPASLATAQVGNNRVCWAQWGMRIAVARLAAGCPINHADCQIAAIARSRGASVATRDIDDFEGSGIGGDQPLGGGMSTTKLTAAVEAYLADLRRIRASGGATGERSYYPALSNLLNAVGGSLRPKVFCVSEMAQQGAGHPDFGLYAAKRVQKGQPKEGQLPECGVVEVKPAGDDAWLTADSEQVSTYWNKYRLVLVTNTRDFVLLGEDAAGKPVKLETFRLAESAGAFESKLQTPRAFAHEVGAGLGEYLCRALSHRATLVEPKDVAWLLASYARDGLARVEAAGDAPSLAVVRSALEEALGVRFEGEKGAAFFRSTLVQTLFYGVFSAWVLWARQTPAPTGRFNWHEAVWHLRAPVLRALFQQVSSPSQLQPLGLIEVLDWTAAALDRVERGAFFDRFNEGEAVAYFYEPFLEAFDPVLRKQLGVWYTPAEVVRYMVARVDRALRDDLGIADGLAAENVYVLDPCCGTGAYLAEVLRRIAANLQGKGLGALTGAQVKRAATERVFGFEIMPRALRRRAPAGRADDARAGRAAVGGWDGARRGLPHQRPDRLGAQGAEAIALPGAGGGAGPRRPGEAGHAGAGDPGQSALQRLCRHGGGRRAGAHGGLPED